LFKFHCSYCYNITANANEQKISKNKVVSQSVSETVAE